MFGDLFNDKFYGEDCTIPHLFSKNIKNKNFHLEFPENQRKNALKALLELKSELENRRIKVINEILKLVGQIYKTSSKILQEMQAYSRNLDKIILQIVGWEQMDKLQLNRPIWMLLASPKIDISQLKEILLPTLYINSFALSTHPNFFSLKKSNYLEESSRFKSRVLIFVKGVSRLITRFDPKRLNLTDSTFLAPQELEQAAAKCLLPDGTLFFHSKCKCQILYPFSYLRSLPAYKISFLKACAIYIDGFVYLFEGLANRSAKLSINNERWSSLSVIPFEFGQYSTCAQFKKYILLASLESKNIFYYDISIDSYSEIPLNGLEKVAKAIFVKNDKVFLLEFSRFIYESDESLMVWNKVGKCTSLRLGAPLISCSIEYKEKQYFADSYGLYSLDLKEKRVDTVEGF